MIFLKKARHQKTQDTNNLHIKNCLMHKDMGQTQEGSVWDPRVKNKSGRFHLEPRDLL